MSEPVGGPLLLRFWGVRGSVPTAGTHTARYGGNTACVEVRYGNESPLIFDAGTGICRLGLALPDETAHLFLSHFHWDHIQGLPFFTPIYRPEWRLMVYSRHRAAAARELLAAQCRRPYFPAGSALKAAVRHAQVPAEGLRIGGLIVRTFALRHPDGCAGYRIDAPQASIVYATDHELDRRPTALDRNLGGADILICDAQYTPEEYECRKGWGHSTWQAAARTAREQGVKQLLLFHHHPEHDDGAVTSIVAEARAIFENTMAAAEGQQIALPPAPGGNHERMRRR